MIISLEQWKIKITLGVKEGNQTSPCLPPASPTRNWHIQIGFDSEIIQQTTTHP